MNRESKSASGFELNLHTPLLDIIGCELPIIGAGMGGVARADLAAAVTNKGGLGTLGMVRESPDFIRSQVAELRNKTDKPFSVNIIPAATDRHLLQSQLECLIDLRVPVVTLFWDVDHEVIDRLKQASITVIHQVGSTEEGLKARVAGADVLIAQGCEAGGHIHGTTVLQNLLPALCADSTIPVVAAGGIANGQQMLAALALGAQGICLGTALLATDESNAHQIHKTGVVQATGEDTICTDEFFINWPERAKVRVLKNPITAGVVLQQDSGKQIHSRAIGTQDGKPVYLYSTDSPLQGASGSLELMPLYSGQSCAQIDAIVSVATRIDSILAEANRCYRDLSKITQRFSSAESVEQASSPCSRGEISSNYDGYADITEIREVLESLLAAERAGARVCAHSMKIAPDSAWLEFLRAVHRDEANSCGLILECIALLSLDPHDRVGDFVEKCLAITDFTERMHLLNKGQKWVVRMLEGLLPRLKSEPIRQRLLAMKKEHLENIQSLSQRLGEAETFRQS
ncbi:MAG: nitronate monooxygenase [Gammaproteobacteria bacterium]